MLKTNAHNSILILVLFVLLFGNIRSQGYDVTIWGLTVGTAELQMITDSEITFKLKSNEYIDYVFPIDLEYYSKFDVTNYTLFENKKSTEQGREEQNYEAKLSKDDILIYHGNDSISIEPKTHSLLSLLVKIMNSSVDSIDTKWLNLENEGILYKTRFLWSDSTTLSIGNKDILCDHYRLDLKLLNDDKKIFEKTDYFNELFFDINSIRQIWIEKWQKQQRIIKIAIKNNLINLNLTINN
jgi:hypothetical protein